MRLIAGILHSRGEPGVVGCFLPVMGLEPVSGMFLLSRFSHGSPY